MTDTAGSKGRSWGYWAVVVLAVVIVLFGLPIFGGGAYLIWLGGSWYYFIAGIGLLATAWFLVKASMLAVWVYLATWVFTLIWALWEKGFDGWAQVPRLVAPTVILVLVLAAIPVLRRRRGWGNSMPSGRRHSTPAKAQAGRARAGRRHTGETIIPTAR
ncbi:hypothetical protein [Jiella pelagia]|uniref:Quinoprotein glucose dehydrogenase n=1 Tax=Jiella pelagia TaxID=2986949 RepID=A0ABY7BXT1_9HYPH|nr:hypothetical protein [Jiella pelagia]WAP68222.1 hypothetical protein OH818_23115 [Jiella pelagia]